MTGPSSRTQMTRRAILQSAVAATAARAAAAGWKPKLGIYCRYSPANIAFAGQEGFTCLQLAAGGLISPDSTDEQLAEVKRSFVARGLTLVALNGGGNHLDPAARQRFEKMIELAGRLGVSFIGGSSGAIAAGHSMSRCRQSSRLTNRSISPRAKSTRSESSGSPTSIL